MKLAICAVAKKENAYINDWIKYHIDLGFNKIFLYDNNDPDYEDVEERIDEDLLKYIKISRINGIPCEQGKRYQECYDNYNEDYDWIAFIDIDEFITLGKNYDNIISFLSDPKFESAEQIKLAWETYGDGGVIEGDESVPVYERITYPANNFEGWPTHYASKVIVRGGLKDAICKSTHVWSKSTGLLNQIDAAGNLINYKIWVNNLYADDVYIRHYRTKTLAEYIKYKLDRTDAVFNKSLTNLSYFFVNNKKTPEHETYLKKMGIIK